MSTYSALFYHLIWSTKEREKIISSFVEDPLHKYINGVLKNNKRQLIEINGMEDHIHLLVRTSPDIHLPSLVKDIKISATKMIRNSYPGLKRFSWQEGYGIFSVSKSNTDTVQEYIKNQKQHHAVRTFDSEWLGILEKHGIPFDAKYVFG